MAEQAEKEEAKGIVARYSRPQLSQMMAQVWKIPYQQDDINWAEKQAPEDRQATEDVDAMTQYGVEEPEKLSELRTSRATGQPRVIASGDHVARGRLGRSQGDPQRLKRAMETCMTSCKACKTYTKMAAVVDSQRSAWRDAPTGNARNRLGLASVGDLAKSKTKKRQGRRRTASALFDCL